MKTLIKFILIAVCGIAIADDRIEHKEPVKVPTEVLEMFGNSIRLSKDGTGIVSNVQCKVCKSNVLKITKSTKAYVKGKPVDIVQAKKEAGNKVAVVRFNTDTNEVIYIRW